MGENDGLHVLDRATGEKSLIVGPRVYAPRSADEIVERRVTALTLKKNEYVRIVDSRTGGVSTATGEARFFLEPGQAVLGGSASKKAWALSSTQYVRLRDSNTAAVRVVRGEALCFPGPYVRGADPFLR